MVCERKVGTLLLRLLCAGYATRNAISAHLDKLLWMFEGCRAVSDAASSEIETDSK